MIFKITSHKERQNIQTNQQNKTRAKMQFTVLLRNKDSVGGILCCLQIFLPQELWRFGLKGQQEIMCSDGYVCGRNKSLFHLIIGDWGYLWEHLL